MRVKYWVTLNGEVREQLAGMIGSGKTDAGSVTGPSDPLT